MPQKRRKVKKTKEIEEMTPKELLDEIAKEVEGALYWMDKEWTEYVNDPNLDPPLFYEVSMEIQDGLCRRILGIEVIDEEDEEKIYNCVDVADAIVEALEDKYDDAFVRAWVEIHYSVNEEIFKELVETLKRIPKEIFEKDELERDEFLKPILKSIMKQSDTEK